MKPTSINVQITKCPKQYEAVRLGIDASLDAGETVESAIKAATEQLNALYMEMYTQGAKVAETAKKEPTNGETKANEKPSKKEVLQFGDKRVQQIVARIEKAPEKADEIIAKAREWYEWDDKVEMTLKLAAKVA